MSSNTFCSSNLSSLVISDKLEDRDLNMLHKETKAQIESLEEKLKGELEEWKYNESIQSKRFLLRYVLSYRNKFKEAEEAVTKALKWRKNHKSFFLNILNNIDEIYKSRYDYFCIRDKMNSSSNNNDISSVNYDQYNNDVIKNDDISNNIDEYYNMKIKYFPSYMTPYLKIINKLMCAGEHKQTKRGESVVIIRISLCNFTKLIQIVPFKILVDYIVFSNEIEFWLADKQTKENNYLHKTFRVIDLSNFSFCNIDTKFYKIFSLSSRFSEYLHPQLVCKTILANTPSLFNIIIQILKGIDVSPRALEKIKINKIHTINKSVNDNNEISDSAIDMNESNIYNVGDEISKILDINDIPSFLNGKCNCINGCIYGFLNTQINANNVCVEDEINKINEITKKKEKNMPSRPSDLLSTTCMQEEEKFYDVDEESEEKIKKLIFSTDVSCN